MLHKIDLSTVRNRRLWENDFKLYAPTIVGCEESLEARTMYLSATRISITIHSTCGWKVPLLAHSTEQESISQNKRFAAHEVSLVSGQRFNTLPVKGSWCATTNLSQRTSAWETWRIAINIPTITILLGAAHCDSYTWTYLDMIFKPKNDWNLALAASYKDWEAREGRQWLAARSRNWQNKLLSLTSELYQSP